MARIVQRNDWLEEETANMAREGLRTLVMARKKLGNTTYSDFAILYHAASIKLEGIRRNEAMSAVVAQFLEHDLELLGLTGVEDKLQDEVKSTLEMLRNDLDVDWSQGRDSSLYRDFNQVGCEESIHS